MSGVYISGMEMPTRCAECWLMDGLDGWCCAKRGRALPPEYRYGIKDRPDWCPLVPVPPHRRLIDADEAVKLLKSIGNREYRRENGTICDAIKMLSFDAYTPTVIPAERGAGE